MNKISMADAAMAVKGLVRGLVPPPLLMRRLVARELKYGEPELLLLRVLCDKSAAMIDVGANLGTYSYVASDYAARVYAIEPNPEMVVWLGKTKRPNVTVLPMAASDREGTQTLYIPTIDGVKIAPRASLSREANPGAELEPVEIMTKPLDSMAFGTVGFIKIDVEGHEQTVLRGALDLIRRDRPSLQIECEERHGANAVATTVKVLGEFGYRTFFWRGGALHPIERFDPERDQRLENWRGFEDWHNRTYINNFLFVHASNTALLARLPLSGATGA